MWDNLVNLGFEFLSCFVFLVGWLVGWLIWIFIWFVVVLGFVAFLFYFLLLVELKLC